MFNYIHSRWRRYIFFLSVQLKFDIIQNGYLTQTLVFQQELNRKIIIINKINPCLRRMNLFIYQFPIILCMGILVIVQIFHFRFLADLHALEFGESKKHKVNMVSGCSLVSQYVNQYVCQLVCQSEETILFEQIVVKTSVPF